MIISLENYPIKDEAQVKRELVLFIQFLKTNLNLSQAEQIEFLNMLVAAITDRMPTFKSGIYTETLTLKLIECHCLRVLQSKYDKGTALNIKSIIEQELGHIVYPNDYPSVF